MNIFKIT